MIVFRIGFTIFYLHNLKIALFEVGDYESLENIEKDIQKILYNYDIIL